MAQKINSLPTPPTRLDQINFATRADAFVRALTSFVLQTNVVAAEIEANYFAALQASNASAWVGTTPYQVGDVVFSPIDFLTYRAKTTHTSTDDPSTDPVRWLEVTGTSPSLEQAKLDLIAAASRITTLEGLVGNLQVSVSDEGNLIEEQLQSLNIAGNTVSATTDGNGNVTITVAPSNPIITIRDENALIGTGVSIMRFTGAAITVTGDNDQAIITINAPTTEQFSALANANTGDQNTFTQVTGDVGGFAANTKNSVINFDGGTGIEIVAAAGTIQITNTAPNVVQNVFRTVTANTGTTTANSPTDTLSLNGTNGVVTSITGDVVTIETDGTALNTPNALVSRDGNGDTAVRNLVGNTRQRAAAIGDAAASQTLNLNTGHYQSATVTQATTFVFSNPSGANQGMDFKLLLRNGGAFAVTWPASVVWPGGVAPTLSASGMDILTFHTMDAGNTWYGVLTAANYA